MKIKIFAFACLAFFAAQASGTTIDALLYSSMESGKTQEAKVTQGPWVKFMQDSTGSKAFPFVKATSEGRGADGCWRILQDVTMPDIPTRDGKIIGDYQLVSRIVACPDGTYPKGVDPVVVLDCKIAGQSCMPPR